ncbi:MULTISPECIES: hypothetical protein [unclassified Desulfovibrio]|uniref:hypothetical protein n=1 Tax=unclassified Desulfovibrio TaxID=2593640 RepID=UPI002FDB86E0
MYRLTALLVMGLLFSASMASAAGPGHYEKNVAAWKPHGAVNGLEYKMALNPALFNTDKAKASFKKLWEALSAASAKNGFVLTRSEKDKLRLRARSYYDTENLALRDAGFVVRITTNYKKDGSAKDGRRLTVKTSGKDPAFILGTPLSPVGVKGEIAAEDHPYLDTQGNMGSRLEKSVNIRGEEHTFGDLDRPQLHQFSRFVPALAKSGLAPETPLKPVTVCTYSAKMGFVDLAGVEAEITFEAWTPRWGGEPIALEVSVGIEDQDYYTIPKVVAAGDEFYRKVLVQGLAHMKLPDGGQFGGSKLKMLRDMQ